MLDLNSFNQVTDIVNLLETGLGNQPELFPQLVETLMSGNSSSFDFLGGGEGDDILDGGTDKNWLVGSEGNDILIDGDGGDLMLGGDGSDQFRIDNFDIPESVSTILDFDTGTDRIKINNSTISFDSLSFSETDGNTTIYQQDNPLATLIGVNKDSLTADSFIFSDDAIANQFQATADFDFSVPISQSPSASQSLPDINFAQIQQFIENYISQLLNTPLQEFLTLFTSGDVSSQSQSISISGTSSSDAIIDDNSYEALENRQYNFARSYID
ncbi:MAG: hypothetical protein AAF915_15285 [Cyanobacteria bacterium P01_D01_bin.50]